MPRDDSMPDYSSYSYEELESVYRYVDREKYPERFKIVKELLSTRIKKVETELTSPEEKKYLQAFLVGESFLWIFIGVLGALGYIVF